MAFNFKTATPDTSIDANAFMFGADSQSSATPSIYQMSVVQTLMWNSPNLVTPSLGVATGTSLAIGGAALGGNALAVAGAVNFTSALTLGTQQTTQGSVVLANTAAGAFATTVKASNSASAAWSLTLPTTAGTSGYVLTTDGSGVSSWSNPTSLPVNLTINSTAITSGTSGRILYDNSGTVGELTTTGSGSVVLATTPTFATSALFPAGSASAASVAYASSTNSGMFFPATSTVAFTTGGSERVRIDSAGQVGIGATPGVGRVLTISASITGSTSTRGLLLNSPIQSDVTSDCQYFRSNLTTAAASFTLSQFYHFAAYQTSLGAGSAITTQYGFYADSTILGSTTNFGFYSSNTAAITSGKTAYGFYSAVNIATGGGTTWGVYSAGTAPNLFAGSTIVGTAALATNATDGFLYIPTCAGAPTGAPTSRTGTVAMVYDTTNNNFYIYNGAWKKVALA